MIVEPVKIKQDNCILSITCTYFYMKTTRSRIEQNLGMRSLKASLRLVLLTWMQNL
jgi:hypothetical protein